MKKLMNRIFGLKYKYPQSFIDNLEKWLGLNLLKLSLN